MTRVAELRRSATEARRLADHAKAETRSELVANESPGNKAARLEREATAAETALKAATRTRRRRTLALAVRLALLAFALWCAWRIGYETGLVAAIGRACAT